MEYFPPLRKLFESWLIPNPNANCSCGSVLLSWCDDHLRSRFGTAISADGIFRGGELSKFVRYGAESTPVHLKGYLWSPKTHEGILYPFRILHSCKETCEEWCTVCLYDLLWARTGHLSVLNDIDVSTASDRALDVKTGLRKAPAIMTCAVMVSKSVASKAVGLHKSLGDQRCSKLIKSTWDHAGWHKKWRTHDLRGIAPSKAINMGFPKDAAIRRGRWAKKSSAFEKHYLRIANFEESSPDNATKSFESVIRLKETMI